MLSLSSKDIKELSSVIIHVEQKIKMSHARVRQSAQGYRESAVVIPVQDLSWSISKNGCSGCDLVQEKSSYVALTQQEGLGEPTCQ